MMKKILLNTAIASLFMATTAAAETWTMDSGASVVGFGSVKSNSIGEAHTLNVTSGTVADDGTVNVQLDLASIQTNIDVRNERIGEFVLADETSAQLTASVDTEAMNALGVGEHMITEVEGDLTLLGNDIPVYLDMFIMRTAEDQVLVTSNSMLFVSTEEAGIDAGIDTLMELASLSDITRTLPVTLRFIFNAAS
ncbi:polyisoprenoid-binding protein YceI [Loktanella ponticola]|uniref:Polyisoprenoid-binding protein YceI n=1 Tax=Yoonia ponticola TaxID=1524255 RepID=A0A7W9BL87_9RHOB|nr:YceI family protein [Yoonia ponticola]MBB5722584.1 polyisoprenoid-binding protein YceI [Yoonia ponticola]